MPTSDRENKDWALEQIVRLNPQTIVDVGPGNGTYSDLARTATTSRWACIEAWGPYVTEFDLWAKYDHVVISDIRHTDLHSIEYAPDLVIVGDVLEHIGKAEAKTVLKSLQAWADNVLVCIPVIHNEQHAVGGNWFEIHRDHWTSDELRATLGAGIKGEKVGDVLAYFWWGR